MLRNQHNAEPCFARHHAGIGLSCLFERNCLDHCRHATQRTETERCITSCRVSRQRACYLALSENEIHARDFDRLGSDAEVYRDTSGTQALESRGHCLAARSGYQNDLGAAKRLEGCSGIVSGAVDVVVSSELLRQLRRFCAATNRRDFETQVAGVLDSEMTETPDSEYGDKLAGLCRRIAQSVESRESRAQQRRSIC